jgi:hypothetical protein
VFVYQSNGEPELPQNTDPLVPFPRGTTYTALSYEISAAYISASTPHTEACYEFISALAQQPGLIQGMPARRSQIDSPVIEAAHGPDAVAFYRTMDTLMQRPDAIIIPQYTDVVGGLMLNLWLNRAFDRYVEDDVDLETELAEAETYTREFQNCAAGIAAFDPVADDFARYFEQIQDCAVQVDPTVEDFLIS